MLFLQIGKWRKKGKDPTPASQLGFELSVSDSRVLLLKVKVDLKHWVYCRCLALRVLTVLSFCPLRSLLEDPKVALMFFKDLYRNAGHELAFSH